MRLIDRMLTRRRDQPRFSALPPRVSRRLALACRELARAEEAITRQLGLPAPPRLLMVDEEEAVVLSPRDRADMLAPSAPLDSRDATG